MKMMRKKTGRVRIVHFAVTNEEYDKLEKGWRQSTIINLSEYTRRVLFGKPITCYTRNRSLDELVAELIPLRRELSTLVLNFDRAIQRLDAVEHLLPIQHWHDAFEHDKTLLISKVDEIKIKINSISVQWLQ